MANFCGFDKPTYSERQIKRNDGSIQANCATNEILIPKLVISIPISNNVH